MTCRKCSCVLPDGAVFCLACGVRQQRRQQNPKSKGNGTGSIYKDASRSGWVVAYTTGKKLVRQPDGTMKLRLDRHKKTGFPTKKAANEYLAQVIASGEARHMKKIPTVAQLYDQYENAPGKKPGASTLTAYRTAYNRRIGPAIGDLEIDVVTLQHLEGIVNGLTYDPAKDVKDLMSKLFQRAMADGFVQVNPCTLLSLPEKNSAEIPAWLPEEVERLWHAWDSGDRIAATCLLMIHTGMMPGELFKLKVDMIDWDSHTIIGCGLKTKERKEKPIVFPSVVEPVLRDLCSTTVSRQGYVLGMNKDKYYDLFTQLKKSLDIRPEVRPYSSRHSTATELELLGVSPSVIASVLRHKSYATTAKHYIDIATDKTLAAVDLISRKPG